jgi:hypothetical protein
MQTDIYTKAMLTIIAVSLVVIAGRGEFAERAYAQIGSDCGSTQMRPCYFTTPGQLFGKPIEVKIVDR